MKIKIFLSCILLVLGCGWLFLNALLDEDDYVEFSLSDLSDTQINEIEQIMVFSFPDDLVIEKMTTKRTFVDDQLQGVYIYSNYSKSKWSELLCDKLDEEISYSMNNEKNVMLLSYYGNESALHSYILRNGVELRGKYILICTLRLILVICITCLPWIPYGKILKKIRKSLQIR